MPITTIRTLRTGLQNPDYQILLTDFELRDLYYIMGYTLNYNGSYNWKGNEDRQFRMLELYIRVREALGKAK